MDCLEQVALELTRTVGEPARWPIALDSLSDAVDARGAAVLSLENGIGPVTRSVEEPFDLYVTERWHEGERDLRKAALPMLNRGLVVREEDVLAPDVIERSELHRDLLARLRLRWWVGVPVGLAGNTCIALLRQTSRGAFSARDVAILDGLKERIAEVAELAAAIGSAVAGGTLRALDAVGDAALAIDRLGGVVGANAAADAMLGSAVWTRHGLLRWSDPNVERGFSDILMRLRWRRPTQGAQSATLVVRDPGGAIVARVLPLDAQFADAFGGAAALVLLRRIARPRQPPAALLAALFRLTPAEARLASQLGTGASLDAVVEHLSISKETARTQLRAIFAKTATSRQGELVALLTQLQGIDRF